MTHVLPRRRACLLEKLESRLFLSAGPLGMNTGLEYVDVMKDVRDWSPAPGAATVTRDANGWPTSDASIAVLDDRVNQPWNGPDPMAIAPGHQRHISSGIQWRSAGVSADVGTPILLSKIRPITGATNTTSADVVVSKGNDLLILRFHRHACHRRQRGQYGNHACPIDPARLCRQFNAGSSPTI